MIEKILERLEEKKAEFASVRVDYAEGLHDGYMKAIKIVQEVAKEYGKDTNVRSNDWISVEERLPKEFLWGGHKKSHEVFITYLDSDGKARVDTDNTYNGKWFYFGDRVIAWMPKTAPAPYQKAPSRCDTCTHYVADEVPPICYMCSKGIEDNYQKGE